MLIILFVSCLILTIVMIIGAKIADDNYKENLTLGCTIVGTISAIALLGVMIAIIVGTTKIAAEKKIDYTIKMYEEENAKIEESVTTAVETYLEHEYNIYDSLQGQDLTILVACYPQISSNELVMKQLDIFLVNSNKIKELKEEKYNVITWKYLIYFGG